MKIPCPNCGSTELARVVRALVLQPIGAFAVVDNALSVTSVADGYRLDADSVETVEFPWQCLACTHEYDDGALLQEAAKWN